MFSGILVLILLGNALSSASAHVSVTTIFAALALNMLAAYATHPDMLLSLTNPVAQAAGAAVIFLGPVFFAKLMFAGSFKTRNTCGVR